MRGHPSISFDVSVHDRVVRVRVSGELALATRRAFESLLHEFANTQLHVQLDLSDLAFMDVAGLHALERATEGKRGRLQIEPDVQPQVRRMLTLTNNERLLSPV